MIKGYLIHSLLLVSLLFTLSANADDKKNLINGIEELEKNKLIGTEEAKKLKQETNSLTPEQLEALKRDQQSTTDTTNTTDTSAVSPEEAIKSMKDIESNLKDMDKQYKELEKGLDE